MNKHYSEEELLNKAAMLCTSAEHCICDISDKLKKRGADNDMIERIISRLLEEGFINESRYAHAFVRDKYRFDKWGKIKIRMALKAKYIDSSLIDAAFEEINMKEYLENLSLLLNAKRKSVKAGNDYEINGKLIRFALSRGYEMDDIVSILKI